MKTQGAGIKEKGQEYRDFSMFQKIREGVILLDEQRKVVLWNEGAEICFGLNHSQAEGRIIDEVLGLSQETFAMNCAPQQQVLEHTLESGKKKWLKIGCYPLSESEVCGPGTLMLACDVSDMVSARRRAEQDNQAKSEFLAHVNHEIRTPLLGILGYCDILNRDQAAENIRESIDTICYCAYQLLGLVNNVLDISSIEAGKIAVNNRSFQVHTMFRRTVASLIPGAMQKGLALNLHIDQGVPEMLSGDEVKIRQVLSNLIFNAIKYTGQGGINVSVEADAVLAIEAVQLVILRVSVSDTGRGIDIEKMEEIFRPYTRLDYSQAGYGGVGLGLAISKQLISIMGGAIWCDHNNNGGATFSFTLPLRQVVPDTILENDVPYKASLPKKLTHDNPLVLVVEDIPVNRNIIVSMLEEMGCQVIAVPNGQECLRVLEERSPDIILMDMQMPVLDGYAATAIIRKNPFWKNIPVIALTAYSLSSDIEKCLEAGCNHYLSKPFSKDELYNTIRKYGRS